jgi:uncharacterized membrane protein
MAGDADGTGDDAPAAGRSRHPTWTLARAGDLGYDRVLFFTDAVFAIAITLLIIDLPVQVQHAGHEGFSSWRALGDAVPEMAGFGISFVVIALFWVGHQSLFRYVTAIDRPMLWLNLLFVGTIAFLPFPTALLSRVAADQSAAVVFYAVCAGTTGLVELAIWAYASQAGLLSGVDAATRRLWLLRAARVPVVFALSIPIAVFSPRSGAYFWAAVFVAGGLVSRFAGSRAAADHAAADHAAAEAAGGAAAEVAVPDQG